VENYKRNTVPNKEKGTLKFEGRVKKDEMRGESSVRK